MKKTFITYALILSFLSSILLPTAQAADYQLDYGDVLNISVWGFDELQVKDLPISPDGKLSFPLVGEVAVKNLSTSQLTTKLTTSLSQYVKNPIVTVNLMKVRTTRVYVLGEVPKPGMFELTKDHTLLDAIGMSGYTAYAAKKKVSIIRRGETGSSLTVNLNALLTKGDFSQNVVLNEGDVVYLSSNGKMDFAKDIFPWISAAYTANRIGKD